jgi:hypothetical protein
MAASETVCPCADLSNLVIGVPVFSVFMILTFSELRTLGVGILVTSIFAEPAILELRKLFVFLEIHKLVIAFPQFLPELANLVSLFCKLVTIDYSHHLYLRTFIYPSICFAMIRRLVSCCTVDFIPFQIQPKLVAGLSQFAISMLFLRC